MEEVMQSNFTDSAVDYDLIMDELLSGDFCLETPNFFSQPFSPLYNFNNMSEIENQDFEEKETVKGELENPNWWIQPREQVVSLKDRLFHALRFITESQRGSDVLAQIWVPIVREGKHFLTTNEQPYWLDSNSQSLPKYRQVSMGYQFSVENKCNEMVGLPGRVYLGKVPEWTPDVRYFSSNEYPRVDHAQKYNVCGTIALPIFERDSRICIGVVEVVLTTQKISYSFELENICSALQAVNLRSSDTLTIPRAKVNNNSYQAALPEIHHVLKTVCDSHSLPLAQTWITCTEQDKHGSRHSDENYKHCISTVDSACYIKDLSMLDFHKACSEHHLFRDQGVAGKAFTTNQPCFSNDITCFTKTEYPLSHYAKLYNLRAAVAIRLRSILTGKADFVLEFFFPVNCITSEEHKNMIDAFSITIQIACQTLRVVDDKEIENDDMLEVDESYSSDLLFGDSVENSRALQEEEVMDTIPYNTNIEFGKQEVEELGFSSDWDILSKVECPEESMLSVSKEQKTNVDKTDGYSPGHSKFSRGRTNEKRRTKSEKSVSLEVLRQHFAGSLKDAAKNVGVCPTTLKRICRTHGITRWPSRKIKKVGNSLQKLQVVIDSVQGAEGTFQFSSVYENLTTKASTPAEKLSVKQDNSLSTSPSSSCSHSSNSCFGSNCSKKITFKQEATNLERANSVMNLHVSTQEEPIKPIARSLSHSFIEIISQLEKKRPNVFRVKAFCGDEKARLRLESTWGYRELKEAIMRRFNISKNCYVDLKYIDDDSEWVLLTCDEDLQECIDVYKSSNLSTIKMSVHQSLKS